MYHKEKCRPGMVTTEVALSIVLATAVLFFVLGFFNDSLKNVFTYGGYKNTIKGNNVRTSYSAFGKDYTKSQINVVTAGEQGLNVLRRKANNLLLNLIENPFSTANKNVASILYLATAVNRMVGEPDVCVYMAKGSIKTCGDGDIGGYAYHIDLNSTSAVTIKRQETGESITLPVSSTYANLLKNNPLTAADPYASIGTLSAAYKPYIPESVLLMNPLGSSSTMPGSESKILALSIFKTMAADKYTPGSLAYAHQKCTSFAIVDLNISNGGTGCYGKIFSSFDGFVSLGEASIGQEWNNTLVAKLNALPASATSADVLNMIKNHSIYSSKAGGKVDLKYMTTDLMPEDLKNNPTSCARYNALLDIQGTGVTLPTCTPNAGK